VLGNKDSISSSIIVGDEYYTDCLDCDNFKKFHPQTSQTRVENQLHNFSQQHSHLQIEEGCHGGAEPYVNSHLQIQEGCHGGPEPYVNSHLQIQEGCHGEHRPYVNVQVEKEMVKKEPFEEMDKESIHVEEEVVEAELESVPSHMNLSQNEDSSVPEVISLMVDKEESVVSTTEHKSVQEQGSYPSAGQSCMLEMDKYHGIGRDSQVPEVSTLMVDKEESVSVSWDLEKKADPSTYQELYPASTLNLIASDDNETRRRSSPQIEREATTVSDQRL